MARFTIRLPTDLTGRSERAGNGSARRRDSHSAHDRGDVDAATRDFVSWVECWAGA